MAALLSALMALCVWLGWHYGPVGIQTVRDLGVQGRYSLSLAAPLWGATEGSVAGRHKKGNHGEIPPTSPASRRNFKPSPGAPLLLGLLLKGAQEGEKPFASLLQSMTHIAS